MKKALLLAAGMAMTGMTVSCLADAAVAKNNYDSNNPIYLGTAGTAATGDVWVQVMGAAQGNILAPVGDPMGLTEPGFFDGGLGVIAGVADNAQVDLMVRAWVGASSTYETATVKGEVSWSQTAGANPPAPGLPTPATMNMPSFTMTEAGPIIPEPTTMALGLLGGLAFMARRRR